MDIRKNSPQIRWKGYSGGNDKISVSLGFNGTTSLQLLQLYQVVCNELFISGQ